MEIGYDKVALQEYIEEIVLFRDKTLSLQDESINLYTSCKQQYNRVYTKLEEVAHRTYMQVENAESMLRSAELEYENARRIVENSENEDEKNIAMQRMQQAVTAQEEANKEYEQASLAYAKAFEKLNSLSQLWNESTQELEIKARCVEECSSAFLNITESANNHLVEYMSKMDQVQVALYGDLGDKAHSSDGTAHLGMGRNFHNTQNSSEINAFSKEHSGNINIDEFKTSFVSSSVAKQKKATNANDMDKPVTPIGWCVSNHITAISVNDTGLKTVSISIAGIEQTFPCTMSGIAKAHRNAKASGDLDVIARTSAMFEIERLREDLELGKGESGFTQLGGYHIDVKKQDPAGYESHHIPSQGTQDEIGEMLPTISITNDDHKLTSSYAGKQKKTYQPAFPTPIPLSNYKESIIQNLELGSPGYIDTIKNELLDLRSTTGHRYDGGISAYLDAVIDMLATRGIPKAKR